MAIWYKWLPIKLLQTMVADAHYRVSKAKRPWQVVTGPAAATVVTAARLDWTINDALSCTTDQGKLLQFDLDPPAVIVAEVDEAVRRWRWRAIERSASDPLHVLVCHPVGHWQLSGSGLQPKGERMVARRELPPS